MTAKSPAVVDLTWIGELKFSANTGRSSATLDSAGIAGLSPVETLAAALAGCISTDVVAILTRGRHSLQALRSHLSADRAQEDPHRLIGATLHFAIEGEVPANAIDRAIALSRDKYLFGLAFHAAGHSFHRDVGPDVSGRRLYIDWARGLAVLLMIEAHTIDSWIRVAARRTAAFRELAILGGFAAPLFLWLAGVAVVLSATRMAARQDNRSVVVETICRRGLEIFVLAFLFRLQAFAITPGSYPVTIFRVDILNIIGPSVVAVGILWGVSRSTAALVVSCAAAATAFSMVTPMVRLSPAVDYLPLGLQWYVRPFADYSTFTLFPWAGFVFAGGACGALIAAAQDRNREPTVQATFALVGAGLVGLGWFTALQPTIYQASSFWTTSPSWFAMRVGIMMLALAGLYGIGLVADHRGIRFMPLARFGRSSLFVYWIHVELVYGYVTWPLHARLPLWAVVVAWLAFSALMYGAIVLRDRVVAAWRSRREFRPAQTAIA